MKIEFIKMLKEIMEHSRIFKKNIRILRAFNKGALFQIFIKEKSISLIL